MEFQCSTRMRLCYRTTAVCRIEFSSKTTQTLCAHFNYFSSKCNGQKNAPQTRQTEADVTADMEDHCLTFSLLVKDGTCTRVGGGRGNKNVPITRQSQRPVSSSLLLPVQLVNKGRPAELISRPKWRTYFGSLGARNFTTLFLFSPSLKQKNVSWNLVKLCAVQSGLQVGTCNFIKVSLNYTFKIKYEIQLLSIQFLPIYSCKWTAK